MKKTIYSVLTAILVLLFATALGLGTIHISGQPYKAALKGFEISRTSGFSEEEIMENYNAVMDFLSPFSQKPFDLPSMKYSQTGASHFEDCKPIFNTIYLLGAASALGLALLIWKKRLNAQVLRLSGTLTFAIPLLLVAAVAINFSKAFVLFHKLFFSNDDWLFDPQIDEIITILPEEFFMLCAIVIAAFWLFAAAIELASARAHKKV